jgi:hypothetical protein
LSFSVTGRRVVRKAAAESSEEDAAKAMENLVGEDGSEYHVKIWWNEMPLLAISVAC